MILIVGGVWRAHHSSNCFPSSSEEDAHLWTLKDAVGDSFSQWKTPPMRGTLSRSLPRNQAWGCMLG